MLYLCVAKSKMTVRSELPTRVHGEWIKQNNRKLIVSNVVVEIVHTALIYWLS